MPDTQDLPSNCHQSARCLKPPFKFRELGPENTKVFDYVDQILYIK